MNPLWATWVEFVNSNVFAVTAGAFFAAWAGAAGAQSIADRTRVRAEMVREIRATNGAVVLAASLADWAIALKSQHLQGMWKAFDEMRIAFDETRQGARRGYQFKPDLMMLPVDPPATDELVQYLLKELTPSSRSLRLAFALSHAVQNLCSAIDARNSLIEEVRVARLADERLLIVYLGVDDGQGHTDARYAGSLKAMVDQCDASIFFAVALAEDLGRRGTELRDDFLATFWLGDPPRRTWIDFSEPREKGLIPSEDEGDFASWKDHFTEKKLPRESLWHRIGLTVKRLRRS